MRVLIVLSCLLSCATVKAAPPEPGAARFSGGGQLTAPMAESADQRFVIKAQLQANRQQSSERFALDARLQPNAKAAGAACGPRPDAIFASGFETP